MKKDRRTHLEIVRDSLRGAPSPRVVDGPPAYWTWYDGPRVDALQALDALAQEKAK